MNTNTTETTKMSNSNMNSIPKKKLNKQHKEFRSLRKNPGKKQWQSI